MFLLDPILLLDGYVKDEATTDKVNYQLFISGLGARYTFLLHVNSGKTWQLTEDSEHSLLFWAEFE